MPRRLLYRYSQLVVLATLGLIFLGAMVTSRDAGLSVPDWPLSFGSVNPPGWWEDELVRLEHSHRLVASAVGLLTLILALWIWRVETRRWVKALGLVALALVVIQGVFGGLRVTELSVMLAMVHGCLAQVFLGLVVTISLVLSPRSPAPIAKGRSPWPYVTLVVLVFLQLVLGAVIRHMHAGLAIPDFPTSLGHWIPPMETVGVALNFAHRVGAVAVSLAALGVVYQLFRQSQTGLGIALTGLMVLLGLQWVLGANVVWLARPPLITSLHVLNGTLLLGLSLWLALRATSPPEEIGDELREVT